MPLKTGGPTILVIKNRAIGDTILMTGPLRILRKHRPNHTIDVLVRYPAGELLEGLPYVDRVVSAAEPSGKVDRIAHWARLVRRLREHRYDLVLNFHASFRTALTAKCLRAGSCVANHHELRGRNWFSDLPVPGRGDVKSVIDRDLDVLRAIGIDATPEEAMPEIDLSAAELAEAASWFAEGGGAGRAGPRVFLGMGGSRETKRWPPGHFAELARWLVHEFGASIVMSTAPGDEAWLEGFWPHLEADPGLKKAVRRFSGLRLRQTAKVMSQCSVYVGNDSGLKHLAVALGLRTFTFFGPEAPLEWHPYDPKQHPYAFIDGLVCRTETGKHWCPIPVCQRHGHKCMQDIAPAKVLEDIAGILRRS